MTTTTALATAITEALCDEGWTRRWAGENTLDDHAGNVVEVDTDRGKIKVYFETTSRPQNMVETLTLSRTRSVASFVAIVQALADWTPTE